MNADEFARALAPTAFRLRDQYGIDPRLPIAQAAVETGWGKVIRGNNLYNITAGKSWPGPVTILKGALEYDSDGKPYHIAQKFRAYPDWESSVLDWVHLLQKPRYSLVWSNRGDALAAAGALQTSGYATDPNYARTLRLVVKSPHIKAALGEVR